MRMRWQHVLPFPQSNSGGGGGAQPKHTARARTAAAPPGRPLPSPSARLNACRRPACTLHIAQDPNSIAAPTTRARRSTHHEQSHPRRQSQHQGARAQCSVASAPVTQIRSGCEVLPSSGWLSSTPPDASVGPASRLAHAKNDAHSQKQPSWHHHTSVCITSSSCCVQLPRARACISEARACSSCSVLQARGRPGSRRTHRCSAPLPPAPPRARAALTCAAPRAGAR